MTDIYLSYSEPNLSLAQDLKKDVESCSSLSVALEDHDWEERDDCEFSKHINKAKMFILIATEHSNITAWVIDHEASRRQRRRSNHNMMEPPTLDFSSYEDGMLMLKYVLRVVTGARRFAKKRASASSSTFLKKDQAAATLLKKDQKPTMPQRQRTIQEEETNNENFQPEALTKSFMEANQLPRSKTTVKRDSSVLLVESLMDNYQRILNRVQGTLDATTDL